MKDLLLKPVIEMLQKDGATEDQIATVLADLIQAATVLLYKQALEMFSDEDMQKIESAQNEHDANKLILEIYSQQIGSTPEESLNVFLKEFVEKFIKENNNS